MRDKLLLAMVVAAVAAGMTGCGPNDGSSEYASGLEEYAEHDLEKAAKLFGKSLTLAPDNVDALVMFARVQLDLGKLDEARQALARAKELSSDSDVLLLNAQVAWHAAQYREAVADFVAVANDERLPPEVRSQGMAGLGIVELTCSEKDRARVSLLKALRLNRKNAAAWYHLGCLYRDSFGYDEAALEQFDFYVHLGDAADARVKKVKDEVIPVLRTRIERAAASRPGAARRNSSVAAAAILRGEEAVRKGSFKTARLRYEEAYKADPLSYPAALGLATTTLKLDRTAAGELKALDYYRAACSLRPNALATLRAAGELAAKLGRHQTAVEIYSRAMAANANDVTAIDGLIRALRKVGRTKDANVYQGYRDAIAAKKP